MSDNARQKLQDEMAANPNNKYIQYIGQFVLKHLEQHPEQAAKVLAEGKTIKGSLSAMREEARKSAVDGVGMLTDAEGFAVVLKYYGIQAGPDPIEIPPVPVTPPVQPKVGFDVSLEDLLRG